MRARAAIALAVLCLAQPAEAAEAASEAEALHQRAKQAWSAGDHK